MKKLTARIKAGQWNEWLAWPLWVVVCLIAALLITGLAVNLGVIFGFRTFFEGTLGNLVLGALVYVILVALISGIGKLRGHIDLPGGSFGKIAIIVGAVLLIAILQSLDIRSFGILSLVVVAAGTVLFLASVPPKRRAVTKNVLGIGRPMTWSDIGLGIAGYVVYFVAFVAVTILLTKFVPAYNAEQAQDLGFTALFGAERIIGFIVLVIITPFAEELVMRGFLFGKLREAKMPFWPAAIVVSILFGLAHGQWNVGVDTLMLSVAACYLRELTGTIWPGVIIHMLKNTVAYVMLFVFVAR